LINALSVNDLLDSTYIVLTSKHGQSPIDPTKLAIISPSTVTTVIDPTIVHVVQATEDDTAVLWLEDQTKTADATTALLANQTTTGIQDVWSGETLKLHYPDPLIDPRVPDIIGLGKPGTLYTTSNNKIAEHGGFTDQDVNVPIVISNPNLAPQTIRLPVQTMQIAPTILQLLGLNPLALQAVQIEKTAVLPGFDAAQIALNPLSPALGYHSTSIVHLINGQAQFQVDFARTQGFEVQASEDLINWTTIGSSSIVVGSSTTFSDPDASIYDTRFYRVISNQ
jgi:arylsulfatase A-like enzyme